MQSTQAQLNRSPRVLSVAVLLLVMTTLALAAALLRGRDAGPSDSGAQTSGSRIEFQSVQELSAASQAIVVATLVKETKELVREVSPVDAARADTRVDVVREFAVSRVVKGGLATGALQARWTESFHSDDGGGRFVDISYDSLRLSPGTAYVLFLRRLADPAIGPFWGMAGEPGIAELKGDDLWFVTTGGYKEDAVERGAPLGRAGAPGTFDVSLADVEVAARTQAPTAPSGGAVPDSRGAKLDAFALTLPGLSSEQAVRDALASSGLDRDTAVDRTFCMKVQVLIADLGRVGFVDLRCPA